MNCSECSKAIKLVPSARERAAGDRSGRSAADYTRLFTIHSECAIVKRKRETSELIKRCYQ